jgi:hypothetical protein
MAQHHAPPLSGALAKLEKHPVPQRRIGFVSPLPVSDTVPYMFYGAFRGGVMLIEGSLQLRGYDVEAARAALGELDRTLTGVKNRGAELIVIGGSVLSFAYDRETLLARLKEASEKLGVPVTTNMEATALMMQGAGVHRVAVAHRLSGLDERALADYLVPAGFTVEGRSSWWRRAPARRPTKTRSSRRPVTPPAICTRARTPFCFLAAARSTIPISPPSSARPANACSTTRWGCWTTWTVG